MFVRSRVSVTGGGSLRESSPGKETPEEKTMPLSVRMFLLGFLYTGSAQPYSEGSRYEPQNERMKYSLLIDIK